MPDNDLTTNIQTTATNAAGYSINGRSVQRQPLGDLIEADKYLAAKAAGKNRRVPVKFIKLRSPGASGIDSRDR